MRFKSLRVPGGRRIEIGRSARGLLASLRQIGRSSRTGHLGRLTGSARSAISRMPGSVRGQGAFAKGHRFFGNQFVKLSRPAAKALFGAVRKKRNWASLMRKHGEGAYKHIGPTPDGILAAKIAEGLKAARNARLTNVRSWGKIAGAPKRGFFFRAGRLKGV